MIQRIQTLWLILASALAFASLKIPFFSGNILVDNLKQFQRFTGMSSMFLMILTVAAGIGALIAVFLYKDRTTQFRLTGATFTLSILNIILYFLQTRNFVPTDWSLQLTSLVVFAIPVFLVLALLGIKKDEKLMKSLDRLR
ncbi:MAG: hypothetical protein JWQ78_1268 [Sediminibacterium sp.]|nr:hypothetical protein [Sediminibacterium sp.]